uniref:Uncharacterized protein n=1 Tax=Glossina palpalis gambiensis TaxID=67801 RepID=A0A1B0C0I2_9MUSC
MESKIAGRSGALEPTDNCQPTFSAFPPDSNNRQQHHQQQTSNRTSITHRSASAATTEERDIRDTAEINNSEEQATLVHALAALSLGEPDTPQCRRVIVEGNATSNHATTPVHERPPLAATSHPIAGKPSPSPRARAKKGQTVSTLNQACEISNNNSNNHNNNNNNNNSSSSSSNNDREGSSSNTHHFRYLVIPTEISESSTGNSKIEAK